MLNYTVKLYLSHKYLLFSSFSNLSEGTRYLRQGGKFFKRMTEQKGGWRRPKGKSMKEIINRTSCESEEYNSSLIPYTFPTVYCIVILLLLHICHLVALMLLV
jgi:hypothetical protein